jgi:hypothetical protein
MKITSHLPQHLGYSKGSSNMKVYIHECLHLKIRVLSKIQPNDIHPDLGNTTTNKPQLSR